ncbi:MAG TPA: sigma-70 family RNA polymerase sigma factor [Burkholderiaceae bacterium]|nr:sigma-70 family RNA polymerase sigma factor [Burkholderiaceae bacterium]
MAVPSFNYDAALIASARGDQNAFQNLYQHEAPRMLALGMKMLAQRSEAEELVRDAFVLIWKNAESYDPLISTGRAWMYSILRYRALSRLRRGARAHMAEQDYTDSLPDTPLADFAPRSSLVRAMGALDERQRKPILMAFYNGYTYEQIAARLKLPATQLKAQVQEGLRQIHTLCQA